MEFRVRRWSAPHNVYTDTERLVAASESKEYVPEEFRSWMYEDGAGGTGHGARGLTPTSTDGLVPESASSAVADATSTVEVPRIDIPYEGAYKASWAYDAETGLYTRYQNGGIQKDADGTIVRAKNVAVVQMYATVVDDYGRLSIRTTGSGKAYVFHDGKKMEGIWKRTGSEHIRFETVDGRDIPFARGTTWISVLTSTGAMNKVVQD